MQTDAEYAEFYSDSLIGGPFRRYYAAGILSWLKRARQWGVLADIRQSAPPLLNLIRTTISKGAGMPKESTKP